MRRTAVRTGALVLAVLLALQVFPWPQAAACLPAASPFVTGSALLARSVVGFAALPALVVALLAIWRRRWFCRWLCPSGFLAEMAGRLHSRSAHGWNRWPAFGPWIAGLGFGSALIGYPVFLWMDPLSLFNGTVSALRWPVTALALPAAGLGVLILFSMRYPGAWCFRFCPLGAVQDGLHRMRGRRSGSSETSGAGPDESRRRFLLLAGAGAIGAGAALLWFQRGVRRALRPPGAVEGGRFAALCARCGACVRACPQNIIQADSALAGRPGLYAPEVRYGTLKTHPFSVGGYCADGCNRCNQVCPTGAIRSLSLEQKRKAVMGTAAVDRSLCIAWNTAAYCMVCDEVCPYQAVRSVESGGVSCPEVDVSLCRGCGQCQVRCPADPQPAIVVHPAGSV